jgi:hypothetical protein
MRVGGWLPEAGESSGEEDGEGWSVRWEEGAAA